MKAAGRALCAMASAALLAQAARAAEVTPYDPTTDPKWEAGVFLGAARIPHYRGSDEYDTYVVPLPFVLYRGETLKAGRGGFRGIFFQNVRFDASLSMSGNPPVDSSDEAREGMPELPPLMEAGPAMKWWPIGKFDASSLFVELAARATGSIDVWNDYAVAYQGLRGELSLNYRKEFPEDTRRWRIGTALLCYAADSRYNSFFYDVDDRYATPDRPAFEADGGYGGVGISAFLTRRVNSHFSCAIFGRLDHINGAVFEDSPLVDDKNNFTCGGALVWTIFESSERVLRDPANSED